MYAINFDKYINILNWDTIYYGIEKDLIESKSAIDYVNKLIEVNSQQASDEIIEILIFDDDSKESILNLINKFISHNGKQEISAERLLRYIILDEIKTSCQTPKEALNSIEGVYADFEYPSDMSGFISYMPDEDNNYDNEDFLEEDSESKLIKRFNNFMKNEKVYLGIE